MSRAPLRWDPAGRRLFLRGLGNTALALPLLPSLLPRAARAQAVPSPIRYIQVVNPYGPTAALYFGGLSGNQRIQPNVNVRSLAEVTGDISPILGASFSPWKSKISILRGIDALSMNANHQYTYATCASSYEVGRDGDENPPTAGQASLDMLMSRSSKVYGASVPAARRLVNLNPVTGMDDYSNNRSFSWQLSGTAVQMVRPVKQTQALFDAFAGGFSAGTGTTMSMPANPKELALIRAVYSDYKAVRDGTRISVADKQKLDMYMSLVNDIEKDLGATAQRPAGTCAGPAPAADGDLETTITNQFRILAAAMACDLTRVASITLGMSAGYSPRHDEHHGLLRDPAPVGIINDLKVTGVRVTRLLGVLDSIREATGSLLDNSIVYWGMQYGMVRPGAQHNAEDMPVLVAGTAAGKLRQGYFIDYRGETATPVKDSERRGVPINNALVTFMNCMGLSSSDYEKTAGNGYGLYPPNAFNARPDPAFWQSTAGRRAPLPHLYVGPTLG
jgi:Protein of unknown function (DUF1552)